VFPTGTHTNTGIYHVCVYIYIHVWPATQINTETVSIHANTCSTHSPILSTFQPDQDEGLVGNIYIYIYIFTYIYRCKKMDEYNVNPSGNCPQTFSLPSNWASPLTSSLLLCRYTHTQRSRSLRPQNSVGWDPLGHQGLQLPDTEATCTPSPDLRPLPYLAICPSSQLVQLDIFSPSHTDIHAQTGSSCPDIDTQTGSRCWHHGCLDARDARSQSSGWHLHPVHTGTH